MTNILKTDLSIAEIRREIDAIGAAVGGKCCVWAQIWTKSDGKAEVRIYPKGVLGSCVSHRAETWRDAFAGAKARLHEVVAAQRVATTRRMALKIIDLAVDGGIVTDRALRLEDFTPAEVAELSAEACALANEMAQRGPFRVIDDGASNGEAA